MYKKDIYDKQRYEFFKATAAVLNIVADLGIADVWDDDLDFDFIPPFLNRMNVQKEYGTDD